MALPEDAVSSTWTIATLFTCAIAVLYYALRRQWRYATASTASSTVLSGASRKTARQQDVSSSEWWHSPLAHADEAQVIADAQRLLIADGLEPLPRYVHLELLRQLRALSTNSAAQLAAVYGKHLRWRRANVLRPADAFPAAASADAAPPPRRLWYASGEHAHGDWARSRVELGLCIGRASGGHPVKLERIGKARIGDVCAEPNGPTHLLDHYYSLLETMLIALNAESEAAGRLLRMYEVFDLGGLSVWQCTVMALKTVTQLLTVVVGVYAETTCKAVLINLPRAVAMPVRGILSVLPERVARRVLVVGEGETFDFGCELDDEAQRMLHASGPALSAHVGTALPGTPEAELAEHWPGRPVGEGASDREPAPPLQEEEALHEGIRGRRRQVATAEVQDRPVPAEAVDVSEFLRWQPAWLSSGGW